MSDCLALVSGSKDKGAVVVRIVFRRRARRASVRPAVLQGDPMKFMT